VVELARQLRCRGLARSEVGRGVRSWRSRLQNARPRGESQLKNGRHFAPFFKRPAVRNAESGTPSRCTSRVSVLLLSEWSRCRWPALSFLRAIAHVNPGTKLHPLLFGGFVHRLRVVSEGCARSANKRHGGSGRIWAVRHSMRIPIWLTYSARWHRRVDSSPHCNY
jgi:hypothetical protein